jgi:hypothetical protein
MREIIIVKIQFTNVAIVIPFGGMISALYNHLSLVVLYLQDWSIGELKEHNEHHNEYFDHHVSASDTEHCNKDMTSSHCN